MTSVPRSVSALICGTAVGILGGLIGLGGAEFRLPILLGLFHFAPLQGVIVNKAISLVVVASALPFRASIVPWASVIAGAPIIVNLLAGSLIGAWVGASTATRLQSATLRRVIAVSLAVIAVLLLIAHDLSAAPGPLVSGALQVAIGIAAGFVIGAIASLMGVAGGEFLIPTLILLFGVDVKLAGSLSLAVSLPTMLVGFTRYSHDRTFEVLVREKTVVGWMAVGSLVGTFIGGRLLGIVPNNVLLPLLALILAISSVRLWRHRDKRAASFDVAETQTAGYVP